MCTRDSHSSGPWLDLYNFAESRYMSLLPQACKNSGTQQAVHFLLALFREVTTLYRSRNANLHPKPEVSINLQDLW